MGPYSAAEIEARIANGSASTADLAWCEGLTDWKPIFEISFFRQTTERPPLPPTPAPPPSTSPPIQSVSIPEFVQRLKKRPKWAVRVGAVILIAALSSLIWIFWPSGPPNTLIKDALGGNVINYAVTDTYTRKEDGEKVYIYHLNVIYSSNDGPRLLSLNQKQVTLGFVKRGKEWYWGQRNDDRKSNDQTESANQLEGVYSYTGPLLDETTGLQVQTSENGFQPQPSEVTVSYDVRSDGSFIFQKDTGLGPYAGPFADVHYQGTWTIQGDEIVFVIDGKEFNRMKQEGTDLIGKDDTRYVRVH